MTTPQELLTQALAKLQTANRIDGTKNSYRKDNPNEYQAVTAYLKGGARPAGVTTDMGTGLLLAEDARRELGTPEPPTPLPPDPLWRTVIETTFPADGVLPAPWKPYGPWANGAGLNAGYYLPDHVVVAGGICKLVQKYESSGPARGGPYGTTGAGWYQGTMYADGPADSIDHRTTVKLRIVSTGGITSHRNMPLWWPRPDNFPIGGEEDFFESDPKWGANAHSFFHYSANNITVQHDWPYIDLAEWHTYRFQRRNHKITVWVDDMVSPLWEQQWSSTELPDHPKKPVFQQENPGYTPPAGTTGSEEVQIESIVIDVPA
jgi:hypothetical protein